MGKITHCNIAPLFQASHRSSTSSTSSTSTTGTTGTGSSPPSHVIYPSQVPHHSLHATHPHSLDASVGSVPRAGKEPCVGTLEPRTSPVPFSGLTITPQKDSACIMSTQHTSAHQYEEHAFRRSSTTPNHTDPSDPTCASSATLAAHSFLKMEAEAETSPASPALPAGTSVHDAFTQPHAHDAHPHTTTHNAEVQTLLLGFEFESATTLVGLMSNDHMRARSNVPMTSATTQTPDELWTEMGEIVNEDVDMKDWFNWEPEHEQDGAVPTVGGTPCVGGHVPYTSTACGGRDSDLSLASPTPSTTCTESIAAQTDPLEWSFSWSTQPAGTQTQTIDFQSSKGLSNRSLTSGNPHPPAHAQDSQGSAA